MGYPAAFINGGVEVETGSNRLPNPEPSAPLWAAHRTCSSASSRPSHLLRLVHPPVDQKVGRAFSHRRFDAQASTVSFGIIDEPSALAT